MPEYRCVNIGIDGYPVWLTLGHKSTIAAIDPTSYPDRVEYQGVVTTLVTTVSIVVEGCFVEVKTPLPVDSVCRILGFVWDETAVVDKPAPPEAVAIDPKTGKPEGE